MEEENKAPKEKVCNRCNEIKSAYEFWKDKSSKDGLDSWCKTCWTKKPRKALIVTVKGTLQDQIQHLAKSLLMRGYSVTINPSQKEGSISWKK